MKRIRTTRRGFLVSAAAAAAGPMILPRLSLANPPSGRLQHASIGVGGMGKSDLQAIIGSKQADIVALCDVDAERLAAAKELAPNARTYTDWRELLDKEAGNIDSVNVATPDHMHASIAYSALMAGKHTYCQKPLAHEVYEVRRMALTAKETGLVTQMGNQIHSHESYRTAMWMLEHGTIGKVKEWHTWLHGGDKKRPAARPEGSDPVPATLAWDLWLGSAPERPYKEGVYHPFNWRDWKDFGTGSLGDFGCHLFDPIFMGIKPGPVLTVRAEVEGPHDEAWPDAQIIQYELRGSAWTAGETIKATWYDGGKMPPKELLDLPEGHTLPDSGSMIIGEEGTMVLKHWDMPVLYPLDKYKDYPQPDIGPRQDHYRTWVEACLGKNTATSNFLYAGPLTETVLLGNIANRFPGETLVWDSATLRFDNRQSATKLVRRDYREGWDIEALT